MDLDDFGSTIAAVMGTAAAIEDGDAASAGKHALATVGAAAKTDIAKSTLGGYADLIGGAADVGAGFIPIKTQPVAQPVAKPTAHARPILSPSIAALFARNVDASILNAARKSTGDHTLEHQDLAIVGAALSGDPDAVSMVSAALDNPHYKLDRRVNSALTAIHLADIHAQKVALQEEEDRLIAEMEQLTRGPCPACGGTGKDAAVSRGYYQAPPASYESRVFRFDL